MKLRGAVSQQELAQRMSERGQDWQQKTVSRVEKGTRDVKLFEAVDLAAVLGVSLDELMSTDESALAAVEERAKVAAAQTKLQVAFYSAVEGQQELLAARCELWEILEHIKTDGTRDLGNQLALMDVASDFSFWSALVETVVRAGETGVLSGVGREDLETTEGRKKIRETVNKVMGVDLCDRLIA